MTEQNNLDKKTNVSNEKTFVSNEKTYYYNNEPICKVKKYTYTISNDGVKTITLPDKK